MNTQDKIKIMQAYLDGKTIEFRVKNPTDDSEWFHINLEHGELELAWDWSFNHYRVMTHADDLEWTHIHPDFRWMARDADGKTYIYNIEPVLGVTKWSITPQLTTTRPMAILVSGVLTHYKNNGRDWKDSLVHRSEIAPPDVYSTATTYVDTNG